jgi:hypothetical protein
METVTDFDLHRQGRLKLKVEFSRFGSRGEWVMDIGAGQFGSWKPTVPLAVNTAEFRSAAEAVIADGKPHGETKLLKAVRERGVKCKTDTARRLLEGYVADPEIPIFNGGKGYQNAPA